MTPSNGEIMTFDITEKIKEHYSLDANDVLKAEAKGSNVLILWKVNPRQALNGRRYAYQIEYRWLSRDITCQADIDNQNFVCVKGQDFSLCSLKEIKEYKNKSLFDMFHLF